MQGSEPLYGGRVGLKVADTVRGAWALPIYERVSVGRLPGAGIHIPDSWVPSRLCRFLPYEQGWLVQLGRARATVRSKYLDDVTFRGRTIVALQPGQSLIAFPELDDYVRIAVVIGAGQGEGLPLASDTEGGSREPEFRTAYPGASASLTPTQRRVMAVTFHHLMTEQPPPSNLAAAAAVKLGTTEANVKVTLGAVRRKVNDERWMNLEKNDQLGHYLVRLTRTITWDDLPPELQ